MYCGYQPPSIKPMSIFQSGLGTLVLSRKNITTLAGLSEKNLADLKILYLQDNQLTNLEGLGVLSQLQELHLEHNKIASLLFVQQQPHLKAVYLEGNPIAEHPHYRLMCLVAFGPRLTSVDGKPLTMLERNEAAIFAPMIQSSLYEGYSLRSFEAPPLNPGQGYFIPFLTPLHPTPSTPGPARLSLSPRASSPTPARAPASPSGTLPHYASPQCRSPQRRGQSPTRQPYPSPTLTVTATRTPSPTRRRPATAATATPTPVFMAPGRFPSPTRFRPSSPPRAQPPQVVSPQGGLQPRPISPHVKYTVIGERPATADEKENVKRVPRRVSAPTPAQVLRTAAPTPVPSATPSPSPAPEVDTPLVIPTSTPTSDATTTTTPVQSPPAPSGFSTLVPPPPPSAGPPALNLTDQWKTDQDRLHRDMQRAALREREERLERELAELRTRHMMEECGTATFAQTLDSLRRLMSTRGATTPASAAVPMGAAAQPGGRTTAGMGKGGVAGEAEQAPVFTHPYPARFPYSSLIACPGSLSLAAVFATPPSDLVPLHGVGSLVVDEAGLRMCADGAGGMERVTWDDLEEAVAVAPEYGNGLQLLIHGGRQYLLQVEYPRVITACIAQWRNHQRHSARIPQTTTENTTLEILGVKGGEAELALNNAPNTGMWATNSDHFYISASLSRMMGFGANELEPRLSSILDRIFPADRPTASRWFAQPLPNSSDLPPEPESLAALSPSPLFRTPHQLATVSPLTVLVRHKNGTLFYMLFSVAFWKESTRGGIALSLSQLPLPALTDPRMCPEELELVLNREGTIIQGDVSRLFPLLPTASDGARSHSLFELVHPQDQHSVRRFWESRMLSQLSSDSQHSQPELRTFRSFEGQSGTYRWLRISCLPDGANTLCTLSDVTAGVNSETLARLQRDLALALSQEGSLHDAFHRVIETICFQLPYFDSGAVYINDPASHTVTRVCGIGFAEKFLTGQAITCRGPHRCGWVRSLFTTHPSYRASLYPLDLEDSSSWPCQTHQLAASMDSAEESLRVIKEENLVCQAVPSPVIGERVLGKNCCPSCSGQENAPRIFSIPLTDGRPDATLLGCVVLGSHSDTALPEPIQEALRVGILDLMDGIRYKIATLLLKANEANLASLFSNLTEMIAIVDDAGSIVHANRALCTNLRWRLDELVGKSMRMITQEDSPNVIRTKHGTPIPVATSVVPCTWSGRETLVYLFRDVTLLKEHNDIFQATIECIHDAVEVVDEERRIIYANSKFQQLFQLTDEQIHTAPISERVGAICRLLQDPHAFVTASEDHPTLLHFLDGQLWEMRIKHFESSISRLSGFVISFTDLSARARAEELAQMHKNLNQAMRTKNEFLGKISHEVRTPLNGISGALQLLLSERAALPPTVQDLLTVMQISVAHLTVIVSDLIDFSALELGRLRMHPVVFSLRKCIQNVVQVLEPMLLALHRASNNDGLPPVLLVDVGANVPDNVRGDEARLRQVLFNICHNSIKHTSRGSITVHVELVMRSRKENQPPPPLPDPVQPPEMPSTPAPALLFPPLRPEPPELSHSTYLTSLLRDPLAFSKGTVSLFHRRDSSSSGSGWRRPSAVASVAKSPMPLQFVLPPLPPDPLPGEIQAIRTALLHVIDPASSRHSASSSADSEKRPDGQQPTPQPDDTNPSAVAVPPPASPSLPQAVAPNGTEEEGEMLLLKFTIKDTGAGIRPELIPHLFELFAAHESTTQQSGASALSLRGSGLGLPIVHQLVRMMGGDVSVRSEVGQGTTLTFTILLEAAREAPPPPPPPRSVGSPVIVSPLVPNPTSLQSPPRRVTSPRPRSPSAAFVLGPAERVVIPPDPSLVSVTTPPAAATVPLPISEPIRAARQPRHPTRIPLKILVAEDNSINRLVLTKMLARFGQCDVTSAEDGIFAVESASTTSYDLIFMDIQMPRMDGLESFIGKPWTTPEVERALHEAYEHTLKERATHPDPPPAASEESIT
ncbi:putative PAS domain S-box protein [Paratrimastix pyriformis]|uniref:PAS domain S-box protein n=1 Tax=Paratrimastix pyriformis TaxID=342808 RepID=A0ABQ8URY0_9EUKA|nr:putative PAS domain S-box protein [Paratrimastix pyriformis]